MKKKLTKLQANIITNALLTSKTLTREGTELSFEFWDKWAAMQKDKGKGVCTPIYDFGLSLGLPDGQDSKEPIGIIFDRACREMYGLGWRDIQDSHVKWFFTRYPQPRVPTGPKDVEGWKDWKAYHDWMRSENERGRINVTQAVEGMYE